MMPSVQRPRCPNAISSSPFNGLINVISNSYDLQDAKGSMKPFAGYFNTEYRSQAYLKYPQGTKNGKRTIWKWCST